LRGVKERGYAVKLDTNGSYPEQLSSLLEEGLLDYVAMDIKNTPEKYALTAGLERVDLDAISQSMEILRQSGVPYEFRTTVTAQTHTVEDIARIAAWIQGAPRYFLQNFKDSGDIIGEGLSGVDADTLARMVEAARKAGLDANAR
jgi:anaerobic ribonucleoside-triphosphate reductase activating protein